MPGFRYRATGPDGAPLRGVIQARDRDDARLRLDGRGWQGVRITAARLPPVREAPQEAPRRGRRWPLVLLVLILLLAGAALLWHDPYGWGLLSAVP